MELEITTSIYIDIDYIIEYYNLHDKNSDPYIIDAIDDYVCGMDDCDYVLIGKKERKEIFEEIKKRVDTQLSLF